MPSLAPTLLLASTAIVFTLGAIHLLFTFRGRSFHPREEALLTRMREVPMRITRETTIWRAMVGFHASHSLGVMMWSVVYAYLALAHPTFLFASPFLLIAGLVFLLCFVGLAKKYWFRVPFRGVALATLLYAAALGVHWR